MNKTIQILLLLLFSLGISAQEYDETVDSVEALFLQQLEIYPQEKIYVQTDKPGYLSGERIWLRAHLVDALTHQPMYISRYVYVEIISPMDDLVERIKIRPDSTGAYGGYIDLEEDLAEGAYTLRAYTNFMRNRGEEYFFRKTIDVFDPFSLLIEPLLKFDVRKNNVEVTIQFVNTQTQDTIVPDIVSCKLSHRELKILSAKKGAVFNWNASLPAKVKNRSMLLSLAYKGRKYNRFYTVPYEQTEFDVSFFPEGGYLIPETICQVAFKAVSPGGLGEDISGTLYDSKDEKILDFSSIHLGMGLFNFIPSAGETYYAVCTSSSGTTGRFELPPPEDNASIINARIVGSRMIVSIKNGSGADRNSLALLVHHKGQVIFHESRDSLSEAYIFPAKNLPAGIISVLLVNSRKEVLSERMLFNWNENDFARIETALSKPSYKRREHVSVRLKSPANDSVPLFGSVAVSVTDKGAVIQDTINSIVSTLLLSSELKGYIESPASYFNSGKINVNAMDALMMTQGWRRYDIPKLLLGEPEAPGRFEPELAQRITGEADGVFRSLKEGEISLIATLDSLVSTVTTQADEKGKFAFDVEYPAGTSILIQSLSRKGGKLNVINIERQTFPQPAGASVPLRAEELMRQAEEQKVYLQKADEEYTQKSGIRNIMLEEVTVVAKSIEKYQESKFYSPISASGIRTAEDIEKMVVSSLRSLLYSQPGIVVKSDKVTTTRSDLPVLFVIDNMNFEDFFDRLDEIDVSTIESIFVVRDNSMMPGYFPNTSGAIVITTKMGYQEKPRKSPNIDQIIPLGYQQAAQFYSPKYETPDEIDSPVPDLRTTIYWNQSVQFSGQEEAVIEFYTADAATTYQVIAEGVGSDGKIIRFTREIDVTDSKFQK